MKGFYLLIALMVIWGVIAIYGNSNASTRSGKGMEIYVKHPAKGIRIYKDVDHIQIEDGVIRLIVDGKRIFGSHFFIEQKVH
jgi:hypothetical protein